MNRSREKIWFRLVVRDLLSRSSHYLARVFLGWVIVSALWSICLAFPVLQQSFVRETLLGTPLGGSLWMELPIEIVTRFVSSFNIRNYPFCDTRQGRYMLDISRVHPDIPFNDPITTILGFKRTEIDRMVGVEFVIEITPSALTVSFEGQRVRYLIGKDVFFDTVHYSYGDAATFRFYESLPNDWNDFPRIIHRHQYVKVIFYEDEMILKIKESSSGFSVFPFNRESEDSYQLRLIRVGDIERSEDADGKVAK